MIDLLLHNCSRYYHQSCALIHLASTLPIGLANFLIVLK